MGEYEVGVRAFAHFVVDADSDEEAVEKAKEKAGLPYAWSIEDTDPVRLK
jgi:hypothetical protein